METKKTFLKKNTVTVKIVTIAVLILLMLIPISMIKSMIKERNETKANVQSEISSKWGGNQELQGPILVIPIKKKSIIEPLPEVYAYFLPEDFNVEGQLIPERRSRGMYQVLCFQSKMNINGKFSFPDYQKLNLAEDQMEWGKAFFIVGVSNLQGIKNKVVFNIDGKTQNVIAGLPNNNLFNAGLTINYPLDPTNRKDFYKFDFDLTLNGTEGLYFIPIGKQTSIHLQSDWNTVSFVGDFLPNQRAIDSTGFDSQWNIFDYNRNYSQMWIAENDELSKSRLGVDLLLPIDHYQKTMRSVKYAIMFIALTFLVFFMIELLSKRKIHPVQYLLVSFALILFYSMLLAFSEHIGFGWSYLLSAIAIIGLITAYSKSIFQHRKQTIFMGIFLVALYVFLYVVIQLEDMALLLGTIGLFIALAIVMYTSRKVNWYKEDDHGQIDIQ